MAIVVNNPAERTSTDTSGAGWAIAIVVLIAVLFGLFFFLPRMNTATTPTRIETERRVEPMQPTNPGANIDIRLPEDAGSGAGSGGATAE